MHIAALPSLPLCPGSTQGLCCACTRGVQGRVCSPAAPLHHEVCGHLPSWPWKPWLGQTAWHRGLQGESGLQLNCMGGTQVWVCRGDVWTWNMGVCLGKVISVWTWFSKHLATGLRASPATWTSSWGSSWGKDKTRKRAGQGVFVEGTTPPLVVNIFADPSEPQELLEFGG